VQKFFLKKTAQSKLCGFPNSKGEVETWHETRMDKRSRLFVFLAWMHPWMQKILLNLFRYDFGKTHDRLPTYRDAAIFLNRSRKTLCKLVVKRKLPMFIK
jgi:hypothetical protein